MPRIEKAVFISYRRTNFWTALAIFQNLHANGYDVFFDYKSIPSGDFEQVIIENIKSRAHFLVILTPSALERCHEPEDWLRREIETAIDNQRNIIPLMMESFDFGSPATVNALTGKLENLKKYNALGIPAEYFEEAMVKLRSDRFLNRPLESVFHPVSDVTKQITEEQKSVATEATPVKPEQITAEEWFERGYVFQEDKNFEEAIRCYTAVIGLQPDLFHPHNNLGILWKELKRFDKAEAAYRKAIELNPSDAHSYANLGNLLCDKNLKRYDEAEAAYRKAIELNPLEAHAYFGLGFLFNNQKRYDEAQASYCKAIELDPSYAIAYSNLGILLQNLKRYDEAEKAYNKAIELDPADASAYFNLGNLLNDENLKRYDEAEAGFRKAIELDPSYAIAYSNLGILLKNLKRYDEAEAAFRKAIELDPSEAPSFSNLGIHLHENLKRYDEAEAAFRKAIELDQSYAIAYSNLGILLKNLKRYDEAEAAYRKAIELDPSYGIFYYNLTNLLRVTERGKEALPLLEKMIKIDPENFNTYLGIASISKTFGEAVSSELLQKARKLIPEDDFYNRACLESICDSLDLAFEYLQSAAQKEKFNPAWAWEDPDLQWIRDDPRFAEIVGPRPENT